ncbi:MAG: hypothetical protein HYY93_03505 [Planctomycetes bacterium]|nr:hypothetical protein [Planctomycetota bacterium]
MIAETPGGNTPRGGFGERHGHDRPRLLLACDRPRLGRILGSLLKREGYEVDEASNVFDLVGLLDEHTYDLVLIDLPVRADGNLCMALFLWRWKRRNNVSVLVCGGVEVLDHLARLVEEPLPVAIPKPCSVGLLLGRVALALERLPSTGLAKMERMGGEPCALKP